MNRAIRWAALASASILGLTNAAWAQVPASVPTLAEEAPDETIVVEARRKDETLQDVPLVVNAVTSENIDKLNLRDFRDIQSVVPGLRMATNSNGIATNSSVRGVQFDVSANPVGTIEYYLNDANMASPPLFSAMYDIGQVEVLRGPQGTLRGRASPSGSITITHRKPNLNEFGGYMTGTVNDLAGLNFNGALGLPIIPGKLAIRVAGLFDKGRGNNVYSINSSLNPYTHTTSGRVFLKARPVDFIDLEGVYQHTESANRQFDQVACFDQFAGRTTPAATALPCPVRIRPEDRLAALAVPNASKQTFDIFTWKASVAFAGQKLYYVGSHLHQFVNVFSSQDYAAAYPALSLGQYTTNNTRISNHEVRLQNETRILGMFDYVVGYFRNDQDSPSYLITTRLQPVNGTVTRIPSGTLRTNKSTEESVFGNLTLYLGDKTEFAGGARHIKVHQNSTLSSVTVAGFGAPGYGSEIIPEAPLTQDISGLILGGTPSFIAAGSVDRDFAKTIFSASAKHRFSDRLMAYANFGTSFRPGNNVVRAMVNARASDLETSFLVLPSETSKSYEVGLKTNFLRNKLQVNLAAFRQDFVNYPLRSASGVPYLQYASLAAAPTVTNFNFVAPVPVQVNGVEAEVNWRVSRRLSLTGNIAYAMGKIRNGRIPCLDLDGDGIPDATGTPTSTALLGAVGANNLSTCPSNARSMLNGPWNGSFQGEYILPVSNSADGFVRSLVTFNGASESDPSNAFDAYPSYALVNLYAGMRAGDGSWEFSLYGKNIFKNTVPLAVSNGATFTAITAGPLVTSPYANVGNASSPGLPLPREFGVTARFSFGSR